MHPPVFRSWEQAHQCRHAALVGLESGLEHVNMDFSAAGTVKVERRPAGVTPGQVRSTPGRRASRAATVGGTQLGVRGSHQGFQNMIDLYSLHKMKQELQK